MILTPVLSPFHSDCCLYLDPTSAHVDSSYWSANNAPLSQAASRSALICFPCFASCRRPLYLVHFSRRQLASVFRAPAPPPLPLRLYNAPSAAVHAALFATSQIQQLLYIAGHMQHFMRVFIPRDRLQLQNPRQELLHFATMVQRVRFTTHQAPTLPNNHGSEVQTASATNARATPRRFCSLQ